MSSVEPSDGPVAVTGASGYIGSHVVIALLKHGYTVHACVTDASNPAKVEHLLTLSKEGYPGELKLYTANLLEQGSYDRPFADCTAVLHVGSVMGYGGDDTPREVHDGAINGARNVLESVKKIGTVKRVVYTSSFAAMNHPASGAYVYTEGDWVSDGREDDPDWDPSKIDTDMEVAYAMGKVETEKMATRIAEEDGRFDLISVCPLVVLGPLLSKRHECVNSWQWCVERMLEGDPCFRGWKSRWNIVDVRDIGEAQALILGNDICQNGSRYLLSAADTSGMLGVYQLQANLLRLFPHIDVGGPPDEMDAFLEEYGQILDRPHAFCSKAKEELGLQTRAVEDTLFETGKTLIELGLAKPALKS
jgi:nucleoside-diphosphate-sugar epimerase